MITLGLQPNYYSLGSRIIEDQTLVDVIADWSRVRSPSRARRRLKRGFPQNIVYRQVPKETVYSIEGGRTLVMHPEIARKMERQLTERMSRLAEDMIMGRVPVSGTGGRG